MVYKPKDDEILYHYCSAETFLAICTGKKLRFSDLFSMNDYQEVHWGNAVWLEVANSLIEEVGYEFVDTIDEIFHVTGIFGLLVACCFSLDGDTLSQWRAYADDGKGYCIGFKARELTQMSVRPLRVCYDKTEQINICNKLIRALHIAESQSDEKYSSSFRTLCHLIRFDLAAFKNPAFIEEKEIRLIHTLDLLPSNKSLKLSDAGGKHFGVEYGGEQVQFRMNDHVPVPFIDMSFISNDGKCIIQEVILGPKNESSLTNISVFLETLGLENVNVRRSVASYR